MIKIKSITDIITNSSNEVFTIDLKEEDNPEKLAKYLSTYNEWVVVDSEETLLKLFKENDWKVPVCFDFLQCTPKGVPEYYEILEMGLDSVVRPEDLLRIMSEEEAVEFTGMEFDEFWERDEYPTWKELEIPGEKVFEKLKIFYKDMIGYAYYEVGDCYYNHFDRVKFWEELVEGYKNFK